MILFGATVAIAQVAIDAVFCQSITPAAIQFVSALTFAACLFVGGTSFTVSNHAYTRGYHWRFLTFGPMCLLTDYSPRISIIAIGTCFAFIGISGLAFGTISDITGFDSLFFTENSCRVIRTLQIAVRTLADRFGIAQFGAVGFRFGTPVDIACRATDITILARAVLKRTAYAGRTAVQFAFVFAGLAIIVILDAVHLTIVARRNRPEFRTGLIITRLAFAAGIFSRPLIGTAGSPPLLVLPGAGLGIIGRTDTFRIVFFTVFGTGIA